MRAVLVVAGFVLVSASSLAREGAGVFRHISIDQGLSDSHVRSIVQDHDGFVWLATADGLDRFDGYEMRIFGNEPSNPRSLASNFVYTLFVDRSGQLWVGTIGGGLHRFEPHTEDFDRYQHDPSDPESLASDQVHAIFEDRRGALWVGTSKGLDRLDPRSGRFHHYRHDPGDPDSLSHDDVYSMTEDRTGSLWIATYGGGLNRMVDTVGRGRFVHYGHDPEDPDSLVHDLVRVVYEDTRGGLWVGTWGAGLDRLNRLNGLDGERGTFEHYESRGLAAKRIVSLVEDSAGQLWVGSAGDGVSRYDPQTDSFVTYRHDPSDPSGLSNDNVASIYEDREGLVWVGTGGGGVNVYDPLRRPFDTVRFTSTEDGSSTLLPDVREIHEDDEGTLWVGTVGDGLYALNESAGRFQNYRHDPDDPWSLSDDVVLSIAAGSSGGKWIGTSRGLDRLDRASGRFHHYRHDMRDPSSLGDPEVISLLEDADRGAVWVGTSKGLFRLDLGTSTFAPCPLGQANGDRSWAIEVRALVELGGALWVASSTGLERVELSTGRSQHFSLGGYPTSSEIGVWAIHVDEDGSFWLGSSTGLLSFDPKTGGVRRYPEPAETRFGMVGAILQDAEGQLWLGRSRGLARFNPTSETFKYYGTDELHLRQGFLMGAAQSRTGRLFFGAGDGLLGFDPSEIRDNDHIPPVLLTGLQIANEPIPIGDASVLKQSITRTEALTLSARDRTISFQFAALSYRAPRANRYRYRLDGFDKDWTEVDSDRRITTYTNLPSGAYVFRVLGSNNDGRWNENGVSLRLQVLPFWWQTWWLRGVGLMLGALVLLYAHQLRLRAVQKRAKELQREIGARKTAEQALREREERNRTVLESLKSHIALLDDEGRITDVNASWLRFAEEAGLGANVRVGENFLDTLLRAAQGGDKQAEEARLGIESVLEGSEDPFDLEYSHPAPSGTLWYSISVVPFRRLEGGAVVSFTDVSDRRRAVEEAQRRREELAHVARVATVGELTASIAHEINQPLASIVTYANAGRRFLDREPSATDQLRDILKAIGEQGKRAGDIIHHLRELLGKGRVEGTRIDVNSLLRTVLELVHGDAQEKGVAMSDTLASGLPHIQGDAVELQQVVLNLIANGFEALTENGGLRELQLRSWTEDGNTVEIAIRDNGPPISEEAMSKMFERFYTSKPGGLGIGLSICRSIVDAHGGTLWAERNSGQGLTLRLSFPVEGRESSPSRLR